MASQDLEQRLVLDIQQASFGVKPNYDDPYERDPAVWYTARYLLDELPTEQEWRDPNAPSVMGAGSLAMAAKPKL